MSGGRRSLGLVTVMAVCVALGCGKRSTGDAPRDSSTAGPSIAPAADTATTAPDTAATPDSATSMRPDTTSATSKSKGTTTRGETPKKTAAAPAVPAAKPTPKPTAPSKVPVAAPTEPPPSTPPATAADTTGTSTQASAPLRDPYHRAPLDTVSQQVYDGWKQFNLNCARCHGEDVQGTTIAPHLVTSMKPDGPINTKQLFVQTVCAGRPAKGMPAWCALGMEMDKIEAIYSYVKGRSDGKIRPGRPAVKAAG